MTCTPLPVTAFRYTGSVATSVFPSPVRISAMRPWCKVMPPIIWTSKCRMPSVRFDTSRTAANASGRRSSRVSLPSRRSRNLAVNPRSSSSLRRANWPSSALISSTAGRIRLTSRSLPSPSILRSLLITPSAPRRSPFPTRTSSLPTQHGCGGDMQHVGLRQTTPAVPQCAAWDAARWHPDSNPVAPVPS